MASTCGSCTDGELWLRRGTYERETAWAPPHVTADLRLIRIAERDAASQRHPRRTRSSPAPTEPEPPPATASSPAVWRTLEAKAATEERLLTDVHETRRHWESVTQTTRRIAIAADTELRRRHPRHADRTTDARTPPKPRPARTRQKPTDSLNSVSRSTLPIPKSPPSCSGSAASPRRSAPR